MNRTRLKDSLYVYDSVENYQKIISQFIKQGDKTSEESTIKFANLNIKDREVLFEKFDWLEKEADDVRDLMEINVIESFGHKVKSIALEHNSKALLDWSEKIILHYNTNTYKM